MKCNKCGSELAADARFCTECGEPVPEEKKQPDGDAASREVSGLKMSGSLAAVRNDPGQRQQTQQAQEGQQIQQVQEGQQTQQDQQAQEGQQNKQEQESQQEQQSQQAAPPEQSVQVVEKTTQTVTVNNSRVITPVHRNEQPAVTPPPTIPAQPAPMPRTAIPAPPPVIPARPAPMPQPAIPAPPPVIPAKPVPIASCVRCGASIPADRIYCDRCSIIEEGGDADGDGSKSHFGIVIGIIIGVLVLILGGIAFMFRDKIGGLFSGNSSGSEDFETVHAELLELVEDDDFRDADADERRDMAMEVIDSLDEQKLVDGDSVDDSDDSYLYFELSDGTECIIELESQTDSGYLGNPTAAHTAGNIGGRLMTYPEDISALADPYADGDKSALMIDGTGDESIGKKLAEYADDWSECHLKSEVDSDFTVEDFRERLSDYDYVNVFCHGISLKNSKFYIRTSEEISVKSMKKYAEDASGGRIALGYFPGRADYLIKPELFAHYYEKGGLSDTILWFSSCYAMKTTELEKALEPTKCPAVAGVDGANLAEYDLRMQDAAVNYMMRGSGFYDALTSAMSDLKNQGETPADGADLKFLGEKTTSLFTLTEEAVKELEKAQIKSGNVKISVEYDDGSTFTGEVTANKADSEGTGLGAGSTTSDGKVTFFLEEGKYTITVSPDDGGEDTTISREIKFETDADGNVADLVLPTIVIEAPERYPDIVNAVYDNFSVWVKYMTEEYGVKDDFYFWFQDMNMDGKPEFVVGPAVTGAHACHAFAVWEENNGKLEQSSKYYTDDYMTNDILMWHNYNADMDLNRPSSNADSFYMTLYKNNGKYVYIYPISDGDADITVMAISSISCPGGTTTEEFRIEQSSSGDTYYVKGKKVSAEQFKKDYEKYCSALTPVFTYTEKLSYNDLKTSTEKTWKEKLSSSYDAWAAKDSSGSVNLGFNSYVSKLKDTSEPTKADDDDPLFVGKVNTEKDPLNVREAPSTEAKIIGQLDKGVLVDVYGETDGWCEIKYEDKVGYVSGEFIEEFSR